MLVGDHLSLSVNSWV